MKIRDLEKMILSNDGTRKLTESVLAPEVQKALIDLIKSGSIKDAVLIGGMALSYYVKPRYTQDIDIALVSDDKIPVDIRGFKKTRSHCFQHIKTHVEVEIVTPEFVNVHRELFEKVIETSVHDSGIRVASPAGLVSMKLQRAQMKDKADIVEILKMTDVDVSDYPLKPKQLELLDQLREIAQSEKT